MSADLSAEEREANALGCYLLAVACLRERLLLGADLAGAALLAAVERRRQSEAPGRSLEPGAANWQEGGG